MWISCDRGRNIICSIKEPLTVVEWRESIENETYENEQEREIGDMTGFEKFQQKVKDGILAYMPEEYRDATVEIVHAKRNNDQEQVGIIELLTNLLPKRFAYKKIYV